MRKNRMTRSQLDAEIEALIIKKKQLAEEAAETFTKTLLSKDVKDILADLSDEALKQTAKNIAGILSREAAKAKAAKEMKEADTAKTPYGAKNADGVRSAVPNNQNGSNANV